MTKKKGAVPLRTRAETPYPKGQSELALVRNHFRPPGGRHSRRKGPFQVSPDAPAVPGQHGVKPKEFPLGLHVDGEGCWCQPEWFECAECYGLGCRDCADTGRHLRHRNGVGGAR